MAGQGYTRRQIHLHWMVAFLVLLQLAFHGGVERAFEAAHGGDGLKVTTGVAAHFVIGSAILLLVARRLMLRAGGAARPATGAAGRLLFGALYTVLLFLPVTGAVAWALTSPISAALHGLLRWLLVGLVAAHVLWVLIDQYLRGNEVLPLMLRPRD